MMFQKLESRFWEMKSSLSPCPVRSCSLSSSLRHHYSSTSSSGRLSSVLFSRCLCLASYRSSASRWWVAPIHRACRYLFFLIHATFLAFVSLATLNVSADISSSSFSFDWMSGGWIMKTSWLWPQLMDVVGARLVGHHARVEFGSHRLVKSK